MSSRLRKISVAAALSGFCLLTEFGTAQYCQIELTPEQAEIVQDRMAIGLYQPVQMLTLNTAIVPIQWHVVTSSDGTRCITDAKLDQYLNALNEAFEQTDIAFCVTTETDLIVDDGLFGNVSSHYDLRMTNPTPNAIDIYWCPSLSDGELCGTSSYTFAPIQGIAMQTTCMGNNNVSPVLIHEVGHYFDLFHTHEVAMGIECPNSGDCTLHGDLVCDTTPCRNLNFEECVDPATCEVQRDIGCVTSYPPPICDGSLYPPPDTTNYMSYSPTHCLNTFTPGQRQRMNATYWNLRSELHGARCEHHDGCEGDINGDGVTNGVDIALLINAWGTSSHRCDLNQDGSVNGNDLSILLASWPFCGE